MSGAAPTPPALEVRAPASPAPAAAGAAAGTAAGSQQAQEPAPPHPSHADARAPGHADHHHDIDLSKFSPEVREALAAFDLDGSGTVGTEELAEAGKLFRSLQERAVSGHMDITAFPKDVRCERVALALLFWGGSASLTLSLHTPTPRRAGARRAGAL